MDARQASVEAAGRSREGRLNGAVVVSRPRSAGALALEVDRRNGRDRSAAVRVPAGTWLHVWLWLSAIVAMEMATLLVHPLLGVSLGAAIFFGLLFSGSRTDD